MVPTSCCAGVGRTVPIHLLIDRFEAVAADPAMALDLCQWARLLYIVLPEAFADAGEPAGPTATVPGTEAHESVLGERARLRLSLRHPLDAPAAGAAGAAGAPHGNVGPGRDPAGGCVRRRGERWRARLRRAGREVFLGSFATEAEARAAVEQARRAEDAG